MIKFFRHIRQSLIMKNQTGKPALPASLSGRQAGRYFKYAIGEIILVVIGILIALSINNWNENRKLENDKQKLMFALKQEFLINKKTLEEHENGLHKHNANLNKVINFSAGTVDLSIDSLRDYSGHLAYQTRLSMLNSVLEEAISSGKFEMLSDSLKQKLSLIKDYSKSRNDISKINDDIIFNKNGINAEFMLILDAYKDNLENFYVQPPTAMHPDFIKNDEEFISYIKSSKTYEN